MVKKRGKMKRLLIYTILTLVLCVPVFAEEVANQDSLELVVCAHHLLCIDVGYEVSREDTNLVDYITVLQDLECKFSENHFQLTVQIAWCRDRLIAKYDIQESAFMIMCGINSLFKERKPTYYEFQLFNNYYVDLRGAGLSHFQALTQIREHTDRYR